MATSKLLKDNIINIFTEIEVFIENSEKNEDFIKEMLILFFNFIFLLKKLCNQIHNIMEDFNNYKINFGIQVNNILN